MKDHVTKDVHVTALYTQTARKASFIVEQDQTVQHVLNEAYHRLGESHRTDDQYYCHQEPRVDLSPYLHATLQSLRGQGVCFHDARGKLEFMFDIEAKPGGAV